MPSGKNIFAGSEQTKHVSPQAAQLSIHFVVTEKSLVLHLLEIPY